MQASKPVTTCPKVLPHRYKTQMCKNFQNGNSCPFGQRCNYAHGESQLEKYLELAEQYYEKEGLEAEEEYDQENFSSASNNEDNLPEKSYSDDSNVKPDWVKKLINSQHESQDTLNSSNTVEITNNNTVTSMSVKEEMRDYSGVSADTKNFCPQTIKDSSQLSSISEVVEEEIEELINSQNGPES